MIIKQKEKLKYRMYYEVTNYLVSIVNKVNFKPKLVMRDKRDVLNLVSMGTNHEETKHLQIARPE